MPLSLFPSFIVALSLAAATSESVQGPASQAAEPGSIALDVPYLPQTEARCGGAAVAMVFRYLGDTHAGVQQFDALVDRRAGGIATTALVAAVEQRHWRTRRTAASVEGLLDELRARHPVVVLLLDRPNRYHYVVVIGAGADRFIVHDPAWGPSRRIAAPELMRRWQAAKFWSLVVVPPANGHDLVRLKPDATKTQDPTSLETPERTGSCEQLLSTAIDDVQRRGLEEADAIFDAVRSRCPDSAGPLRELAGVRFAERRWREAAALAEQALARDSRDEYAWDVLASSRFMQDDVAGALRAWNQIGKPRVDTVQIEGLSRARYALVADALALPAGSLLTEETFRRAERRLSELPGYVDTRIGLRPQRDGFAGVSVAIVERPAHPRGPIEWAANGARTAIDREVSVALPGMTGQGEQWEASWRWWTGRPRVALSFATPHRGVLPGVWRVEGSWEAQSYGFGTATASASRPVVETRAHGGLVVSDWLTADLRYELNAGIDSWDRGRRTASIGGSLERRFASDRMSLAGNAAVWMAVSDGAGFRSAGLRSVFRSSRTATGTVYVAGGGVDAVSSAAPFALWPGAGVGHARAPLLRAHPLLHDGVVNGPVFGERVAYANGEIQRWIGMPPSLPMRVAVASFVDLARASHRALTATGDPFQIDAGIGLRVKVPGQKGTLRIDTGYGVRDGAHALTFGWQF
jgi:hypothetical protein